MIRIEVLMALITFVASTFGIVVTNRYSARAARRADDYQRAVADAALGGGIQTMYTSVEVAVQRHKVLRRLNAGRDPIAALTDEDREWLHAHGWDG